MLTAPLLVALLAVSAADVVVSRDNVEIKESCTVRIAADWIADSDENGAIQITGDGITVDFKGQTLNGAAPKQSPDQYRGYGIRVTGKNVTIRGAKVAGFKGGIYASDADGLTIEDCDVSGNFQQHLRSTPKAEDGADWLWPHKNDENEWLKNYGAGIYVEKSDGVTIRRNRARHGQNGLCLDEVNDSKVYDNDFSFLSGWGIAMWRCNRNVISRNAVDFCVRGYSHGVYNRGQDSAGFLVFEQNNDNVFAENSATHGGDSFFGFAGREALGEQGSHEPDWYKRRGNNNNLLINNDLSYAPAHGIEMTFSFGNKFIGNRLVGNAICGVWGGYSQDTLIAGNTFENNGEMGYGLERGGVNIEHGRNNRVIHNKFRGNKCGVHFWWDPEGDFLKKPWGKANGSDSTENVIAANVFDGDAWVFHFRGKSDVTIGPNTITNVGREIEADKDSKVVRKSDLTPEPFETPEYRVYGETRPVGARKHLRGRDKMIITEWGPYDWQGPYLQRVADEEQAHVYRLLGDEPLKSASVTGDVTVTVKKDDPQPHVRVTPKTPGTVAPYELSVQTGGESLTRSGVLLSAEWDIKVFAYKSDPRKALPSWHKEAAEHVAFKSSRLDLRYGGGGPSEIKGIDKAVVEAKLPRDYFGTMASTTLTIPAGKWRVRTTSDDGVRVWVDGMVEINNWTWHGPAVDESEFTMDEARTVEIRVEHFELDGYAILSLELLPVVEEK
jgi:parallel beta-helix repeat protein